MKTTLLSSLYATSLCVALLGPLSVAQASEPAPERDQHRFEINFLQTMIDHHFGAIKMSELCEGRTVHAELKEMCDMIIAAQSQEIATMQSWLRDWYGINEEPTLTRKALRQVEHLSGLTGEEFEKEYMSMMIEHHSMAARMAVDCLNQAYHPEMLDMCSRMLAAQGNEIVQLRLWLMLWYGIDDPSDKPHGRGGDHGGRMR